MELDNLKSIWQEQGAPAQQNVSKTELAEILKKNSKHPIAMIKRNVLLELWVMIISYSALIIFFMKKDGGLYLYNSIFVGAFLVFGLVYYFRKISILNRMLNNTDQIKSNLNRHLLLLRKYVRFYYVFGVILLPLVFIFTYCIITYSQGKLTQPDAGFFEIIKNAESSKTFLIVGILLFIASPFVNKFYVKKLYGDHLQTIENLVKQVND